MAKGSHGDARIDDLFDVDASQIAESIAERVGQERRRKQTVPITAAWKRLRSEMPDASQFNPRFTTEKETHIEIAKAANLINDLAAATEATRLPILDHLPTTDVVDVQAIAIVRRAMTTPGGTVKLLIDAYAQDRCSFIVTALRNRLEARAEEMINRFVYTGEWKIPTPIEPTPTVAPPIQSPTTPPAMNRTT